MDFVFPDLASAPLSRSINSFDIMVTYQEAILTETEQLIENINKLNGTIERVNNTETKQAIEKLRQVEQKMDLVYTFFKASMYANNIHSEDSEAELSSSTNRPSFDNTNNDQE
ncbi:hypothetical protein MAM1_0029c02282 [Mucor ambiguus]|uniref:DASH complex subunit DAD3 n=1 Tax=Mucor ambiguus TaxID=91626 RepID=A0A0C9LSJ2_9FUNG|nr:hypothetical protein MAM1_0029c02282 [Mucor ambiguus]